MRRNLVFLSRAAALSIAITALTSAPAPAQTPQSSGTTTQPALLGSPAFAGLIQGKRVLITTSDGTQREGVFTVSPTGMIGKGRKPGAPVALDRVVKVEKVKHRVRNGLLLGLASGMVVADGDVVRGTP